MLPVRLPDPPRVGARSLGRVAVQWPRLGPYHLARLRAAHSACATQGVELVALETAGTDETYAWREETAPEPFRREQIFPGQSADALAPRVVRAGVWRALDRLNPDAVAINSYAQPDALAALAWCRRRHRVAVCMTDSTANDAPRTAVREAVKGILVRQFDAAVVAGTRTAAYLTRLGLDPARIFAPYDVVDNAYFASGTRRADLPGLGGEQSFFLASNRFVARKNVAMLVRAFAAYRQEGPAHSWGLVLLGDGPERASLEALVRDEAVPDVTFAGFQQIDALPAYYAAAGAFVHPALMDQWGLVVNEALAAGCPVVVSDRAGAAADLVVEGVTGFRFDPTDTGALAARLAAVAAMPAEARRAMGARGQAHVAAWSPERFADALLAAVEAGRAVSDRGLAPLASLLLWGQRVASRRADSFHAIRE